MNEKVNINGFRYYKLLTKEEYEHIHNDFKGIHIVGYTKQTYAMFLDEKEGTISAPVLVLKDEETRQKVQEYFNYIRNNLKGNATPISDTTILNSFLNKNNIKANDILGAELKKSLEDWHRSECSKFDDFFKAGDVVTLDVIDYFLNVLPPVMEYSNLLQVSEPFDSAIDIEDGKYKSIYLTFKKIDSNWIYAGNCFKGKTKDMTHEVEGQKIDDAILDLEV